MGVSDQTGNELDEFVTETLRNNLLGLPLDLATLNMTRAREAGIPPLNRCAGRSSHSTNDGQLKPYTSWVDFGQNLKHPESLVNFVAAYGEHPTIKGARPSTASGRPRSSWSTARRVRTASWWTTRLTPQGRGRRQGRPTGRPDGLPQQHRRMGQHRAA